ncbi:hypothetical protein H5410_035531 [Solanum commersonii]|uniref:Uncharacterized protein n=1 Tax=Solanum commersonii TaxID=4109 RepID=A0A9J5Y0Y3_SOLCO|nr:hypothetical protein H5410_035531 [Solanum commersonii]
MKCENKICDACKKNCLLNLGKRDHSFFNVMSNEHCIRVLIDFKVDIESCCTPSLFNFTNLFSIVSPKFVLTMSQLTDQETDLEDSIGCLRRIKSEPLWLHTINLRRHPIESSRSVS